MSVRRLRLGIAGLGRAFTLMLPTFRRDPRIDLVAAADSRAEALARFAAEFHAATHPSIEQLCDDPRVEAVYIATPHQFHAQHARLAAERGKHVLVEKPMALSLDECRSMIDAAREAGVQLIVGHSHSFDAPILHARSLIASGALGELRMIHALNYTDFLYRPRRPEELLTASGGGVIFSQAAHQIDVARLLGGGRVRGVRAMTGAWDRARPTEGAYSALLEFESGAFASLSYGGYGRFDSDEFCGWVGELGQAKDPARYGTARRALEATSAADEEAVLKAARAYGGKNYVAAGDATPRHHQHFGFVLASCDRADLRPTPEGVLIYGDREQRLERLPVPEVPRAEVIDELHAAIVHGQPPLHSGEWALATMEVCLAMLQSSRERRDVTLRHQVAARG